MVSYSTAERLSINYFCDLKFESKHVTLKSKIDVLEIEVLILEHYVILK